MGQIAPGAVAEHGDAKKNGRVETELTEKIAKAGDQRVSGEPTNGLRAVKAGVVVLGGRGGAEGDERGG